MQYPDVNFFLRKRYFVCFMTCLGYVLLYILRANLSIAIVEMTSKKNITLENGTVVEVSNWSVHIFSPLYDDLLDYRYIQCYVKKLEQKIHCGLKISEIESEKIFERSKK